MSSGDARLQVLTEEEIRRIEAEEGNVVYRQEAKTLEPGQRIPAKEAAPTVGETRKR